MGNYVTIIGQGSPSNYEITVDGTIEMVGMEPSDEGTIISGGTAEGTIETGINRFRFSGQMANVQLVDWNGISAPESPRTPEVHVGYGIAER